MVPAPPDALWANQQARHITYLVAEDPRTGDLVGTVAGIDHALAFGDPEGGASLWTLAVDPASQTPGVGDAWCGAWSSGSTRAGAPTSTSR